MKNKNWGERLKGGGMEINMKKSATYLSAEKTSGRKGKQISYSTKYSSTTCTIMQLFICGFNANLDDADFVEYAQ